MLELGHFLIWRNNLRSLHNFIKFKSTPLMNSCKWWTNFASHKIDHFQSFRSFYEPCFREDLHLYFLQLHAYVFLVPNVQSEKRSSGQSGGLGLGGRRVHRIFGNNIPDGPSSFDADQQEPAENEGHSELGGELKGLSRSERKSVLQVAAARDPDDLKLFIRWVLNNVQRSA